ncbi:MAG: hypothetical protein JRI45_02195 [Deltaproteobacteria bacterium]|nr:hypothetical protein [Deltaproteobacteria bacterium]MBW2068846.1 hypothetical protein [Deltaproteobacteria bacterium]
MVKREKERYLFRDAAEVARDMVVEKNQELRQLYQKAIRDYGKGELLLKILDRAVDILQDEEVTESFFSTKENLISFMCSVWLQFLLVEIGGVGQDKLKLVARELFQEHQKSITIH